MSIPILYDKNMTNFNTEGLGRLTDTVDDVIVTENTSGFFELEMVYLLDAELSAYIIEGNFIYSHTSERDSDMLKFTIYSVEPDYTEGLLYVNARLTLLDIFMKSVVPEGVYNTTGTHNVLNNLKTHIYPTYNFTITGSDNLKFYLEHEETTVYDIIYGTNGLVEQTGVTLRFYDNGIQVTSTRGNQQPVEITERDFLEQFKIKESRENMVTRIIPYTTLMKDVTIKEDDRWTKDTNETKVYGTPVLSPNIGNGYPIITRYVEYRNEITGERDVTVDDDTIELNTYKYEEIGTLNTEALSFFTDNPNIDEYEITTTIETLGLYENQYGRLESLALYDKADIYIVKHQKLVQTSVTEVVHNVTIGRNTALRFETAKVTIGKVESVLNSGKVSQKELSNIVDSQNQNIKLTNSIVNARGNRVNFVTTLPPASESKEGDVAFLEKDDKVELWEFIDGVWVIDIVVSNDQYIKDKVDEALAAADTAQSEADDARQRAEDALIEAGISTDLAQTAKDLSDTAKTNAQTAIDNAQTAIDNAQSALTEAGNAKVIANTLSTKVDDLEGEVELKANQTEVDGIGGTVSSHTSTLSQHASQISARLTSTQVNSLLDGKGYATQTWANTQITATANGINANLTRVEGKIDGLEIGGRNLLLNSQQVFTMPNGAGLGDAVLMHDETTPYYRVTGSSTISTFGPDSNATSDIFSEPMIDGATYTVSVDVRAPRTGTVGFYASRGMQTLSKANEWVRIKFTYTYSGTSYRIIGLTYDSSVIDHKNWKIEKGNKATDWSPAPEDTMNYTNTQINIRAGEVEQLITDVKTNPTGTITGYNSLKNNVDSMVQAIGSDGGKIAQMVMTDSVFQTTVLNKMEFDTSNVFSTKSAMSATINMLHVYRDESQAPNGVAFAAAAGGGGAFRIWGIISRNGWWTVSGWVRGSQSVDASLRINIADGPYSQYIQIGNDNTWKYFEFSHEVKNHSSINHFVDFSGIANLFYYIKDLKIEQNHKATPYSLAAADVATQSQVTQLADNWALTLKSGNDIKTQINASTDSIRLASKFIHLSGTSLIDDAVIKSAHIESISADKISTGTLNANLVRVVNLDVNSITGNKTEFIQSNWNAINSNLSVNGWELKYTHSDGSYTRLNAEGIQTVVGGDAYHHNYLTYIENITINSGASGDVQWVQLPSVFKGKQFKCFMGATDIYGAVTEPDYYNNKMMLKRFVLIKHPNYNIDYVNARIPILGYAHYANIDSRDDHFRALQGIVFAQY